MEKIVSFYLPKVSGKWQIEITVQRKGGSMRSYRMFVLLRAAVLWGMLLCAFAFSGCSATQLEERSFPMLAAVDEEEGQVVFAYGFPALSQKDNTDLEEAKVNVPMTMGESFEASLAAYEGEMERKADCNHLKVLVLGEKLLQDKKAFYDMLDTLTDTERYPRNTYVCVTEDVSALFDTEENLPQDLGTYLELFLQNHESDGEIRHQNLGTLLDERKNRREVVNLPYISVEDGAIVLAGLVGVDFR